MEPLHSWKIACDYRRNQMYPRDWHWHALMLSIVIAIIHEDVTQLHIIHSTSGGDIS